MLSERYITLEEDISQQKIHCMNDVKCKNKRIKTMSVGQDEEPRRVHQVETDQSLNRDQ
jgi:hypothetical protein